MRYLAIILLLTSCNAAYHVRQAKKHIVKAQAKGATFGTDTSYQYIYRTDTLYNTITKEIEVIRSVIDSVPVLHEVIKYIPLTRYQERIEYKLKRDTLRLIKYIAKKENKAKVKTSPWSMVGKIIIGLWILIVLFFLYKMITWKG